MHCLCSRDDGVHWLSWVSVKDFRPSGGGGNWDDTRRTEAKYGRLCRQTHYIRSHCRHSGRDWNVTCLLFSLP